MNIYSYVAYDEDPRHSYHGTLADAQAPGRELDPVFRCNVKIRLLEIDTDKLGIIQLLNFGGPHATTRFEELKSLRTWTMTSRGGLKEIT